MNSSHREGWPPTPHSSAPGYMNIHRTSEQGPARPSAGQQPSFSSNSSAHQQNAGGPVLPPPPGPFFQPAANPNGPGLPNLGGIAQSSQSLSRHPLPHDKPPASQPHPSQAQSPPSYSLPGINQASQPPAPQNTFEREREREVREAQERDAREREYEQGRREREAQERDIRERQAREQLPHQNHAESIQLHQPVAVTPQRSGIHGPGGLLSSAGPHPPSSGPNGHANLFAASQYEAMPRHAPTASQIHIQNVVPFGPGGQPLPGQMMTQGPHGQQPILNDALSYLDQVKVQFADQPNVYNQFLDIMKDFKSQAIDTPGVIKRVSTLFQGNPMLIQGFNTFLPPGYRIECGTARDPNEIRVTTPLGTTLSPNGGPLRGDSQPRSVPDANGQPEHHQDHAISPSSRPQAALYGPAAGQGRMSPFDGGPIPDQHGPGVNAAMLAHQQEQRGVSQLQSAASVAEQIPRQAPSGMSPVANSATPVNGSQLPQQGTAGLEKRGPVEFNHAISYVNKIKNRFATQPEVYKQFLEILQTYQRESKPIQDVYAQVTRLFSGATDLLEDFKQFLPESAAHAKAAAAKEEAENMTQNSDMRAGAGYSMHAQRNTPRPEQHRLPPVGNFATTPSASRDVKRKRADRQGPGMNDRANMAANEYGLGGVPAKNGLGSNKRNKQAQHPPQSAKMQSQLEAPAVSPTLIPAPPEPMQPQASTAASSDELAFFDRVKKFVGNKNTMNEFLKLCNLYSQDLIDKNSLVYRVQSFIGGNQELFNWFKDFVHYNGKNETIENRARPPNGRISLNNCRALGPSYRLLPRRERMRLCSGRDELCNSVLNDEWASHPTWASEDSGFIAHRKNVHEEGLHRIEEERHDYDHHIAIVERAIQILEPLAHQNKVMSHDERVRWTLPRDLGTQSKSIFKKAITKIYGREDGNRVLENLIERPSSVVPVLLMRCRRISEQWKATQREWEKVWREQTQRMFWKSLDHMGINAKMSDKRQFQTKTLQNEIQMKWEEQKRQRAIPGTIVPKFQAEFRFTDAEVLMDASRLVLTYAEHQHSNEFPRLTSFIRDFIPTFFGLANDSFQQRIRDIFESSSAMDVDDDENAAADESGSTRGRRTNGRKSDLLRDVLDRGRTGKSRGDKDDSSAPASRATTPEHASNDGDEMEGVEGNAAEAKPRTWVRHAMGGSIVKPQEVKPNEPFKRTSFNLYANLPIYCFFRMFQFLYERLQHLKVNEAEVHEAVRRAKMHKPALELKLIDKRPENYFQDTSANANYYQQMLGMFEELLRGEGTMDMAHIEEILRRYYLHTGWLLYTFDRLLSALTRFAISVLNNDNKEKSYEIIQLFLKDRKKEYTTHQDEQNYRRQVEKYVKDGDIYRISFNQPTLTATTRILKPHEPTFDTAGAHAGPLDDEAMLTPEQRWACYVTSYTSTTPTEDILQDETRPPYQPRNVRKAKEEYRKQGKGSDTGDEDREAEDEQREISDEFSSRYDQMHNSEKLELKISTKTYRIFYHQTTDDWWVSPETGKREKKAVKPAEKAVPEAEGATAEKAEDEIKTASGETVEVHDSSERSTQAKDGTEQVQAGAAVHSGNEDDHDDTHEDPTATFEEKFVMNNTWMKGLTRDAVDGRNTDFRGWRDDAEGKDKEKEQDKAADDKPAVATVGVGEDAAAAGSKDAGGDVPMAIADSA